LVSRLGDRIAPRSLGTSFRWLWAATVAGNLGDGLLLAVAPLLVASLTSDPFAIALAVFMQRLPWLLFGLAAGVVVDRVDRRLLSATVDVARALVVGGLTITVATGTVSVVLVYAVVFLLVDAHGNVVVPQQSVELSRDYTAPPADSIGKTSERELLAKEMRREMSQAILRRVGAALNVTHPQDNPRHAGGTGAATP